VYKKKRTLTGGQLVNGKYTLRVGPAFKVVYYLEHHYEPLQKPPIFDRSEVRNKTAKVLITTS